MLTTGTDVGGTTISISDIFPFLMNAFNTSEYNNYVHPDPTYILM